MSILPPSPWRIRSSFLVRNYFLALLLFILSVAVAVSTIWWQGGEARNIVHQGTIWSTGTPAAWTQTKGTLTSTKLFFLYYQLDVRWGDKKGHLFSGKIEFNSLGKYIDENSPPEVHYDPQNPHSFALSSAVKLGWSRWAMVIFLCLTFTGIGVGLGAWGLSTLRKVRHIQHCASNGEEVTLQCTHIELLRDQTRRPSGQRRYFFRTTAAQSGAVGTGSVLMPAGRQPLFLDANDKKPTQMVALCSAAAPQRPVVLRDDLYPLTFTDEEAQIIRYRLSEQTAR